MKPYNPREGELKALGFFQDGDDWYHCIEDQFEYVYIVRGNMDWYFSGRRLYPTCREDIETIIRMLTPPSEEKQTP
jgi:hypothetical protein